MHSFLNTELASQYKNQTQRARISAKARRAGWIGCNLLLKDIPMSGKIYYIKDQVAQNKDTILRKWNSTLFLRKTNKAELRGWLLDTMKYVDMLGKKEFTLKELYAFEELFKQKYPENQHVREKIRQQLQYLRNKGYLQFLGKGRYRLTEAE